MTLAYLLAALLQVTELHIGDQVVLVEIADTDASRVKGLSGRSSLKPGNGMLFIYEKAIPLLFWMKNTLIPLSIGFFDENKILINIEEMPVPLPKAMSLPGYTSARPAQYALEMPQNWFHKHQIRPGMKFSLHEPANLVE